MHSRKCPNNPLFSIQSADTVSIFTFSLLNRFSWSESTMRHPYIQLQPHEIIINYKTYQSALDKIISSLWMYLYLLIIFEKSHIL